MYLSLRGVTKRFDKVVAVDNVDLDLAEGEFVCFLGPSGCGKTTLLRLVAGLETLDAGEILLEEKDLSALPARKRNFGVVFQSYSLFPNMNVARNIAYGLECRKWARDRIVARVEEMLEVVHLGDAVEKYPHELSGGMQQRVALARALAPEPAVLLLDEPLSALDLKLRQHMRRELRAIQQQVGLTFIYITHDQGEALTMSDRVAVMSRGRIEQVADPRTVYDQPASGFVASFVGENNALPGKVLENSEGRLVVDIGLSAPVAVAAGPGRGRKLKPGEECHVFVRPESVSIDGSGQTNRFDATVMREEFEGQVRHLVVKSGETELRVTQVGAGNGASGPGASVTISFAPELAVPLPVGHLASA